MKSLFNDEIKDLLLNLSDKIYQISTKDRFYLQKLDLIRKSLPESNIGLYDLLVSHMLKCEIASPGSSQIFFDYSKNLRNFDLSPSTFSEEDLRKIIASFADEALQNLLVDAFHLAGFNGKVSIAKSSYSMPFVELTKGYVFDGFKSSFYTQNIDIADPVIVVIDGYVESVSELHHLLEKLSETKESMVVFARGFSEEVIHTLKVNYDRKTVICIPVVVNYDINDVNTLNDIAVISGGDIITSLKGQLISSVDYDSLKRVEIISFSENRITFQNKKTTSAVNLHLKSLQEKILAAENDATKSVVAKRIARLGHNHVVIKLPENYFNMHYFQMSFMVDQCLRAVKACSEFGIVDYKGKKIPYSSVKSGEFYCEKFLEASKEIGCILY